MTDLKQCTLQAEDNLKKDIFKVASKKLKSRLIVGTGKYKNFYETAKAVNASGLRCEYDSFGNCLKTNICSGSSLETPYQDDCLGDVEERAWSSPIFVDYKEDLQSYFPFQLGARFSAKATGPSIKSSLL